MFNNSKFIDLTHPLSPSTPYWDLSCGFEPEVAVDYSHYDGKYKFRVHHIKMHAGIGTHIDSPAHCFQNGKTVDELSLDQLITRCFVINVSDRANEKYKVSPADLIDFEKKHGEIEKNSLVLFYTGWQKFWNDREKFHNQHKFPSVSEQAADFLLTREIAGIGIDTLSPDTSEVGFPVHHLFLGNGKYIIENVANLNEMPPVGGHVIALPMNFQGGSEAPIRIVGIK